MLRSSDYTFLIPGSALLGAMLIEVIDVVARLVIAPAELPIGIITAVVGAPVFLGILLRQQRRGGGGRSMVELRDVSFTAWCDARILRGRQPPVFRRGAVQRDSRSQWRREVDAPQDRDRNAQAQARATCATATVPCATIPGRRTLARPSGAPSCRSTWNSPSFPLAVEDVVLMGRYPHTTARVPRRRRDREIVERALELVELTGRSPPSRSTRRCRAGSSRRRSAGAGAGADLDGTTTRGP